MCSSSFRRWPAADGCSLRRCALVMGCAAALAAPAATVAQEGAPVGPGPSLQVVAADLRQTGGDLRFELRFNRPLPVDEIDPAGGRNVCVVLSPADVSRRRVCVSSREGRLSAALTAIDATGLATEPARVLRHAGVAVEGEVLTLRVSARALRVRPGGPVTWRTVTTWRDGGACATVPEPLACVQVLPPSGEYTLQPKVLQRPAPGPVPVRRAGLRLLATGDSMIQIVDDDLRVRLRDRAATVRSDARISTGVSKLAELNWIRTARDQAGSFKPDITVMFLGANDGFPMTTPSRRRVACCATAWVGEYARRVATMMRAYVRGGRSLIYWLTLPAPRSGDVARIYRAVNAAIDRAALRVGERARVIDLVPVFTPGGLFRQTITFHGRTVSARQEDGVHLSAAGAAVAATLVIDRLRADGALPRGR
jgi:lysophospholipase L1-like esterase